MGLLLLGQGHWWGSPASWSSGLLQRGMGLVTDVAISWSTSRQERNPSECRGALPLFLWGLSWGRVLCPWEVGFRAASSVEFQL